MTRRSRPIHWILVLASSLPLVAHTGCSADASESLPSIVLVTVDTLRADHLGCYGYFRDTSPALDALAAEGLLFEQAIATMATTFPSHLSIMTGLYPHQHGYWNNEETAEHPFRSTPTMRTMAEILARAGYETAAFVSGPTVSSKTGIETGFDSYGDAPHGEGLNRYVRAAGATNERVLSWLERHSGRKPFFLWVHYWDPHEPNQPPPPYDTMFASDAELDALLVERRIRPDVLVTEHSLKTLCRMFAPEKLPALYAEEGESVEQPLVDDDAVKRLINRYDGDVRHVDDRMGELFATLREQGHWDRSIVVVTADHGQGLGQHDWLGHRRIRMETTRVPLVMRFPPGVTEQPARIRRTVSLVDLLPTILARLDCEVAREYLAQPEGRDLLGEGGRSLAFTQKAAGKKKRTQSYAITLDDWRYYHAPDGRHELYDLHSDPGELENVVASNAELVESLSQAVVGLLARRPSEVSDEVSRDPDGELTEALRALGYIDC